MKLSVNMTLNFDADSAFAKKVKQEAENLSGNDWYDDMEDLASEVFTNLIEEGDLECLSEAEIDPNEIEVVEMDPEEAFEDEDLEGADDLEPDVDKSLIEDEEKDEG